MNLPQYALSALPPVQHRSGLLVDDDVALELLLHFGIFPLCLHDFHEDLVDVVVEHFVLGRNALVLVIEDIPFENGGVEIVLDESQLIFTDFDLPGLLLVFAHHQLEVAAD